MRLESNARKPEDSPPFSLPSYLATQSTSHTQPPHLAVIMDGNGRWATRRGLPRSAGHRQGAKAVRRVVESAARLGVGTLTLYAFSSDNWRRPQAEVEGLMALFRRFLIQEIPTCLRHGVQVRVIGHRHRLSEDVSEAIEQCEAATAGERRMTLRLAVDYSSRELLAKAARSVVDGSPEEMERALGRANHPLDCASPVDLLVRTSGEKRLSDFLLWECAYAELHFVDTFWPDFGAADVEEALLELSRRQRRFGGLGESLDRTPAEEGDRIAAGVR